MTFASSQFTPTQWDTAENKAAFAEQFVRFIRSDFAAKHFTGDFYASFISPLLPVFADVFALSMTQVGLLAGVNRFLMFIVQPIAGYCADHYRTRLFILGGPILSLVFIPLVGVAPSFLVLILFVCLGSIGQSLFHPPVAGMISSYSGRHFSFCMSIFNMGGTLAFGVGPIVVTALVGAYGIQGTVLSMLIGIPLVAVLFKLVPRPEGEGLAARGFFGSLQEALGESWRLIAMLTALRKRISRASFFQLGSLKVSLKRRPSESTCWSFNMIR